MNALCNLQVFSKEQVASSMMPEYVMVFLPPLVVHNVLPFPITVFLSEGQHEQSKFEIDVGGFVEVYQFDLARKIRMYLQLQVPHFSSNCILICLLSSHNCNETYYWQPLSLSIRIWVLDLSYGKP